MGRAASPNLYHVSLRMGVVLLLAGLEVVYVNKQKKVK